MDRLNDHAAWRELEPDKKRLACDIAVKLWQRVILYLAEREALTS